MTTNKAMPHDLFPDLDLPAVLAMALRWMEEPLRIQCIQKVTLYRGIRRKYVIAVQTPEHGRYHDGPPPSLWLTDPDYVSAKSSGGRYTIPKDPIFFAPLPPEERELLKFCEWVNHAKFPEEKEEKPGECEHLKDDLKGLYKANLLPNNYIEEWYWLDGELREADLTGYVVPGSCWILYGDSMEERNAVEVPARKETIRNESPGEYVKRRRNEGAKDEVIAVELYDNFSMSYTNLTRALGGLRGGIGPGTSHAALKQRGMRAVIDGRKMIHKET